MTQPEPRLDQLDPLGTALLALDTERVQLQVGVVAVLAPPEGRRLLFSLETRFDQVRQLVERRLHLAPPLRRRVLTVPLGLDRPVLADDPEFDLEAHLRRARLPQPGSRAQLRELVAELAGRPLPWDRPLWELVVVEGLAGDRTALVMRLHHALLDGISGIQLLRAFFDAGSRPGAFPAPVPPWEPPPLPSTVTLVKRALHQLGAQPAATISGAQRLVEAALERSASHRWPADGEVEPLPGPFDAPRTSFNGAVGSRRTFASAEVPLDEALDACRAMGVTLNDATLAAVGLALRETLVARGDSLPDPLVALVPISVRRTDGSQVPGNRLSAALVDLPTGIREPDQHLRAVSAAATRAKHQAAVLGDGLLDGLAQAVPPGLSGAVARWLARQRVYDRIPPPANVVVSNLPGPAEALWCVGARVEAIYPIGPVPDGVGLNVTVLSYRGILYAGLVACHRLVPDLDEVAARLAGAFAQLFGTARRERGRAG